MKADKKVFRKDKKALKLDPVSWSFLVFATLFGLLLRGLGEANASFPLNDGGLFYTMIRDIQHNRFSLPVYTSYNGGGIPFAYPPLGFYIAGLLSTTAGWSLLDLMRWLPAFVSTLTIPAFYFLAQDILKSKKQAALAVFIFAFIPSGFAWLIMGGGVTRSWGYLFALLSIRQLYHFYANDENNIFSVVALATLVVLTHPEAAVHTFLAAIFFFFYFSRSIKKFFRSFQVGLGVLLLSSPWWLTILFRHGWSPFSTALLSSQQNNVNIITRLILLFQFSFTDESNLTLIGVLGLLGVFTLLAQKRYFLPIWLAFIFLIEPRSASLYVIVLLAMSSAVLLDDLLFVGFQKLSQNLISDPFPSPNNWAEKMLNNKSSLLLFSFIFAYGIFSSYSTILNIHETWSLDQENLKAFQWIAENTPADSRFLVLTSAQAMLDPVSEWFPTITERVSLATVFGFEWYPDGRFGERIDQYKTLQTCLDENEACIQTWAKENSTFFTHVYFKGKNNSVLAQALRASMDYDLIYYSDNVQVFEGRKTP